MKDRTLDKYRPGQRVKALVDGKLTGVVFSLETEEKGDGRMYCWRYDAPYFPVIPKSVSVSPMSTMADEPPKRANGRYTENPMWAEIA